MRKGVAVIVKMLAAVMIAYSLPSNALAQKVQLIWTVSTHPAISHYGIYRATDLDSSFNLIATVNHPDSVYLDESILLDPVYFYAVTATDSFGTESDFSNIVEVDLSLPTPVELLSFSGHAMENHVVLAWSTASETNNFGFEVERSRNSVNFTKIGFVKGNGTSPETREYQLVDEDDLVQDTYYYRLKQLDHDGSFEYSGIVQVSIGVPGELYLHQNYPNPFNPETRIKYQLPESGRVVIKVFDLLGREVRTLVDADQKAGFHDVVWDAKDSAGRSVSSGTYFYQLKALVSNRAIFRKMMFLK